MSEALTEEYIDSLKVADLRKELKDRDLVTTGKKAELVDRLKEFLQQNEGAGGEDSTDMKVEETSAAAEEPISGKRKAEESDDESEQKQEGGESVTTKKTKVGNEEPEAAATKEESLDTGKEASSVIVVSGFVRPFRFQAAEELFQKHGKVQSFWMNRFRTHAYVVYDDISSAQAASAAVEGLAWPAENGAKLSANFSNEEELETAKKESAAPVGVAAVAAASAAAAADRERKPAGDNEKDNEEDDKDAEEEEDLSNALYTKTEPSLMYIPLTEEQVAAKRRGEFVAPKSTVVPNNQPKKKRNRRRQRGGNPDRRDRGRGDNRDRRDRDRGFDRRDRDRGGDRRERDRGGRSTAWEERRGGSRKYDRDEKDFKSLKTGRVGIFGYDK